MDSNEQTVRNLIASKAEIDADFDANADFRDGLGVDSLMLLEVIVAIEKHFKMRIPEARYREMKTLNAAVKVVQDVLGQSAS